MGKGGAMRLEVCVCVCVCACMAAPRTIVPSVLGIQVERWSQVSAWSYQWIISTCVWGSHAYKCLCISWCPPLPCVLCTSIVKDYLWGWLTQNSSRWAEKWSPQNNKHSNKGYATKRSMSTQRVAPRSTGNEFQSEDAMWNVVWKGVHGMQAAIEMGEKLKATQGKVKEQESGPYWTQSKLAKEGTWRRKRTECWYLLR